MRFSITWNEDGSATVLGRIHAREGTGTWTGKRGEGNFVKIADLSSLSYKLFDIDSDDPDVATQEADLVIADVILDTPDTSNTLWDQDEYGYNVVVDFPPEFFPRGNRRYEMEFVGETTGESRFNAVFEGRTDPIRTHEDE